VKDNPVGPWKPYQANRNQLPFKIAEGEKLLRSPERKEGLADIIRRPNRIKELKLSDAILYSYLKDMRFVLLTCLLIGFSLWWFHVPEQILEKPAALCSPDLGQLVQAVQNTYITLVVSIMCQAPVNVESHSIRR